MKILLDTNIVLDFFLEREPFFPAANQLFIAIANDQFQGYISASTATDIFYICRKQTQDTQTARKIIANILAILRICPVDRLSLEWALASSMTDFEDAVQLACALQQQLDAIVTRNPRDFPTDSLPIWSINQLFEQQLA